MVPAKDFKRRMVVEIDGAPHMIEQIQVQTPSARGAATLYKIKARNLKTKARVEKSYRGTDSLNESSFERRPVQYLYRDPDALHFMDSVTFNQFSLSLDELRDSGVVHDREHGRGRGTGGRRRGDRDRAARHGRAADCRDDARACAAIRRPDAPSPRRSRPASSYRSPSISIRARSCGSTPGPESIWGARDSAVR